jgi:hypothetical protein
MVDSFRERCGCRSPLQRIHTPWLRTATWLLRTFNASQFDPTVKNRKGVLSMSAGIQNLLKILDPDVRRDDGKNEFRIFYGAVKFRQSTKTTVK